MQAKIGFSLDVSGFPVEYHTYEPRDSNRMVEEYMLMANQVCLIFISKKIVSLSCYLFP